MSGKGQKRKSDRKSDPDKRIKKLTVMDFKQRKLGKYIDNPNLYRLDDPNKYTPNNP